MDVVVAEGDDVVITVEFVLPILRFEELLVRLTPLLELPYPDEEKSRKQEGSTTVTVLFGLFLFLDEDAQKEERAVVGVTTEIEEEGSSSSS